MLWTRLPSQINLLREAFRQFRSVLDIAEVARRASARLYARVAALELVHVGPRVTVQPGVRFTGTRNVSLGLETILDPRIVLATEGRGEIALAERVYVGPDTTMFSHARILIEHDVLIAANCVLSTRAHAGVGTAGLTDREPGDIVLGAGSWLASNVVIGPGVTVGAGAVVGAHAVVLDDVPPRTLVAGAPATVRRSF